MRFSPRTWSLLSLLLFVAAVFFWLKGNEYEAKRKKPGPALVSTNKGSASIDLLSTRTAGFKLTALEVADKAGMPAQYKSSASSAGAGGAAKDPRNPYRLNNTGRGISDLVNDNRALLLVNAFIDTANPASLEVPVHLKSQDEPGSYIVQWQGPVDSRFRALLADTKAEIVSYVPNNAYLVKASGEQARQIQGAAGVQAVIPYEPYFKLDKRLLEAAVRQQVLDESMLLRVTLFPGELDPGKVEVGNLTTATLAEEKSPFGVQLLVRPLPDSLDDLAQLRSVQAIEPVFDRMPANDLTRVITGISTDSVTTANYLGLSGSNIWVNMNDTGVDTNHNDLKDRIHVGHPTMGGPDPTGHGTMVAGILAGDGTDSDTVEEAQGSATNANFRGMAPEVEIFALPIASGEDVHSHVLDSYLIETAAQTNYLTIKRTNSLISNNSWGYVGVAEYDSAAARFDAAVRDALPETGGDQPVLYIFAAGNGGFGDEGGFGGDRDSIFSPATAKNVITVGALEHARFITNFYVITNREIDETGNTNETYLTNSPYLDITDSDTQVASFSSRGNVGIGTEGEFGRFKPDLVAPGTMIISTRSEGYKVEDDVVITNEPGKTFKDINDKLGEYRIDSGTTYAAPVVSGLLALIQEFFEFKAPEKLKRKYLSPALMKAIVINGARSVTDNYDLQVRASINYQGWGLPNIARIIPTNLTSGDESKWTMRLVEQNATNALATGESRTWTVTLSTNASAFPLRATLVWTDPPGNPAVAIKLVNDLDLVVTNLDTGVVFYGNNIPGGSDFTEGLNPEEEVDVNPNFNPLIFQDSINNVENVFIREPGNFGRRFSITVRSKRVNVNSVNDFLATTGNRVDVVQDFALVISSDTDLEEQTIFDEFKEPTETELPAQRLAVTIVTNGLPLINERVGANASLVGTNGVTNQWSFYVFTNVYIPNSLVNITNGTNVAFITFNPPNLSRSRNIEADIDLYVSKDPGLTNLVPSVLAAATKSVSIGGTETIIFTNAVIGDIYYVAVKAEDQQGAEFSLIGLSTETPLDQELNGKRLLTGIPFSAFIPDGTPLRPSAATVIAIGISDKRVQRVVATNLVSHQDFGDLVGILTRNNFQAVLNNHNLNGVALGGTNLFVYDDSYFPVPNSQLSEGPGNLNLFVGQKILGPWFFQMIDNAPGHTGRVELLTLTIDPLQDDLLPGVVVSGTLTNNMVFYPIDVPPGVTNLVFRLTGLGGKMIEAYLRRGELPTLEAYDLKATNGIGSTGFEFQFPSRNSQRVSAGTYFLGLYNPSPGSQPQVAYNLLMLFEYGLDPANERRLELPGFALGDNAVTSSAIDIRDDKVVTRVEVGLRLDHPRLADTVIHLVSPQGKQVLLAENRGQNSTAGFGGELITTNASDIVITNFAFTFFSTDTNVATQPIKFFEPPYNRFSTNAGLVFSNSFENALDGNYAPISVVDGWEVFGPGKVYDGVPYPPQVSIITGTNYAHTGTNILSLGTANIRRTLPTKSGTPYWLSFAYRSAKPMSFFQTGVDDSRVPLSPTLADPHYRLISSPHPTWKGPEAYVLGPSPTGFPFVGGTWAANNNSQWIAPYPYPTNSVNGTYTYRTYINLHGVNPATALVRFFWAADNEATDVLVNGRSTGMAGTNYTAWNGGQPIHTLTDNFLDWGLNTIDFVAQETSGIHGIRVHVAQDLNPYVKTNAQGFMVIGGRTNSILGSSDWKIQRYYFVATNDNQEISFHAGDGELWLDSVALIATGDVYVLPEESLELLEGERALGEWRLDVWDNRQGAFVPAPEVPEWQLNLNYADPVVFSEPLEPGSTYPVAVQVPQTSIIPGILFTNQVHYFEVPTCADTTSATVTLTGVGNFDKLELLADRTGLPTTDPLRDDYAVIRNDEEPVTPNGVATFIVTIDSPPAAPLRPGKSFFLAVRNRLRNETNSYTLRVTLDNSSCITARQVTALSNNQRVFSTLPAFELGSLEGELFKVELAPGAKSLAFALEADGDAGLYAREGQPPTRSYYDMKSDQAGSGSERLVIPSTQLSDGTWYVLVVNNANRGIQYSLAAAGDIAAGPVVSVQRSANGVQLSWNARVGATYQVQYSTDLAHWHTAATVISQGPVGNYTAVNGSSLRFYRVIQAVE